MLTDPRTVSTTSTSAHPYKLLNTGEIYYRSFEKWAPVPAPNLSSGDKVVDINGGADGKLYVTSYTGRSFFYTGDPFSPNPWMEIT